MGNRNFIHLDDYKFVELNNIINHAKQLKANPINHLLKDKHLALIFEKSSTRTRISFEVGIKQLGGHATILSSSDMQLNKGETIEDTAKVLSRYVDLVMIRANNHQDVVEFANHASIPIINGLTDFNHPCQVLTDIFTYIEKKGDISGKTICWIGDGNNVCNSWLVAAKIFKFKLRLALKAQYAPDNKLLTELKKLNLVSIFDNKEVAAENSDMVTTDTWVSMGDKDIAKREEIFQDFRIDQNVMSKAKNDAIFMHCLPAYRGKEVTADVIDGSQSVVFDEAENRLHIQKAIMCYLLGVM